MIKVTIGSLTLTICLMVLLCICIENSSARSIAIKNRAGGDLTVVIDFGKKSKQEDSVKKKQEEPVLPKVDETTKQIAALVPNAISSNEEKQIAESLLTFANEVREMEKLIPGSNDDQKLVKQELLAIINEFTKEAEKPSAFILKSSLEMVADAKKKLDQQKQGGSSADGGAQSLFLLQGISVLNDAMNFVDGIGTYSTKMSQVGNWISGKLATKLDSWGLKGVATVSRNLGKGIDGLAKKVAPYEQKLAKFIAPVVKSKTFQSIKRVVNVVGGVISIKNGLKALGMLPKKLPKAFQKLKSTLTKAAAPIKTKAASLMKKVTALKKVNSAKQAAKDAKKAAKAAKAAKKAAKQPGALKKAFDKAKAVKDLKDGAGDLKSGLLGEGKPKKSQTNTKQNTNNRRASNQRGNTRSSPTRTGRTTNGRSTPSSRTTPSRSNNASRGRQTTTTNNRTRTSSTPSNRARSSTPSGRQTSTSRRSSSPSRSSSSSSRSSSGSRSSGGGSRGGRR